MRKVKHRNGVRHPSLVKERAVALRQEGKTHREIVKELGISLGSADLWTKGVVLSSEQKTAIQKRRNKHIFSPAERKLIAKRLKPFQYRTQYRDEDLIDRIRKFYAEKGRIPLKREFNSLRIFRERFGSWNNAVHRAGFVPNPVLFSKRFIANDGHSCDSFTEKIIDDWLCAHDIAHTRNFRYGKTKMTADFLIQPNMVVEFFGLAGVQKKYDKIIEAKKVLCDELGLKLTEVYPSDIFPENRLKKVLRL